MRLLFIFFDWLFEAATFSHRKPSIPYYYNKKNTKINCVRKTKCFFLFVFLIRFKQSTCKKHQLKNIKKSFPLFFFRQKISSFFQSSELTENRSLLFTSSIVRKFEKLKNWKIVIKMKIKKMKWRCFFGQFYSTTRLRLLFLKFPTFFWFFQIFFFVKIEFANTKRQEKLKENYHRKCNVPQRNF